MNENPAGVPATPNVGAAVTTPVAPTPNAVPAVPVAEAEKPKDGKKKKVGLIAGIVVGALVLICGIAAAVVLLMHPGDDAVATAVTRFLNGETPNNTKVDGTITVMTDDETSAVSVVSIELDAVSDRVASATAANAKITATLQNEEQLTFEANEVMTTGGDIYLRLNNVAAMLGEMNGLGDAATNCLPTDGTEGEEATNCVLPPEESEETDAECLDEDCAEILDSEAADAALGVLNLLTAVFETIDGEWIRITEDASDSIFGMESLFDNSAQCLVTTMNSLDKYSNSISELYNQNSFINYSTDNIGITAKSDKIYRLSFDEEKLTAFENALESSALANDLLACTGGAAVNEDLSLEQVEAIFDNYPTVYVEIDDNYNFSRVYFSATSEDGLTTVRADLNLSYPNTVTVVEPEDYINLSDALSSIISQLYYGALFDIEM